MSYVNSAALIKLEEAEALLPRVEEAVNHHFNTSGWDLKVSTHSTSELEVWALQPRESDYSIVSARAGSVIHNLRSAFDYVAFEAGGRRREVDKKKIYFPFRKTLADFEKWAAWAPVAFKQDFIDAARIVAPWSGGNEPLWALHSLSIDDKHLDLHPLLSGLSKVNIDELVCLEGMVWTLGPRSARHFVRSLEGNLTEPYEQRGPLIDPQTLTLTFSSSLALSRAAGHDPFEILTALPGSRIKWAPVPTFTVGFGAFAPDLGIVDALRAMTQATRNAFAVMA